MHKPVNILIIEDDPAIGDLITLYAEKRGYQVRIATTGRTGLDLFYEHPPDLVILDIMLPEMDGWEVCREIRRAAKMPVIMLTGKGEPYDKLKVFELGTDDYLVKPFDPNELMARIKAVLRRTDPLLDEASIIELPSLKIDRLHYQVICETRELVLPPKEMEVLAFLASMPIRSSPDSSCWITSGGGILRAIRARSMSILSGFVKSWAMPTCIGRSKLSEALAINLR